MQTTQTPFALLMEKFLQLDPSDKVIVREIMDEGASLYEAMQSLEYKLKHK